MGVSYQLRCLSRKGGFRVARLLGIFTKSVDLRDQDIHCGACYKVPMSKSGGKSKKAGESRFVLGRARFAKISAVEGLSLTPAMIGRAAAFDRGALSAAERRRAIITVHRKK